jgi:tagatose-1,6-bisphosphate aldolase non-catalytic subunit AgaZ/GatZ
VAQGGLSAAQIASGERSAKLQAASAAAAAQAQARAACFVAGTKIQMNDGSTKEVQNLKIGDITFLGRRSYFGQASKYL